MTKYLYLLHLKHYNNELDMLKKIKYVILWCVQRIKISPLQIKATRLSVLFKSVLSIKFPIWYSQFTHILHFSYSVCILLKIRIQSYECIYNSSVILWNMEQKFYVHFANFYQFILVQYFYFLFKKYKIFELDYSEKFHVTDVGKNMKRFIFLKRNVEIFCLI